MGKKNATIKNIAVVLGARHLQVHMCWAPAVLSVIL